MTHPEGETRKDRFRQWMVGLGVTIIMFSLPTIAFQEYAANKSQDNHHAASVKQDSEIKKLIREDIEKTAEVRTAQKENKGTLTEIQTLQKEVANVIKGLPAADSALATFAVWIEGCLSAGHCSSPPSL